MRRRAPASQAPGPIRCGTRSLRQRHRQALSDWWGEARVLDEIYNLKLGAELVVLSSCPTALGKEVRGEGLISLTRGFIYAGAPRVVASLWRVQDKATAELMKRFYHGLLVEGLTPAAALRAAQIAIRKKRRWTAPYHWAAFALQGGVKVVDASATDYPTPAPAQWWGR